jgi:molybdenum cofactor biosynthesis enzyme MoaA
VTDRCNLRRGLADLVGAAAGLRPRPEISLTANRIGLARLAGPLRDAGHDYLLGKVSKVFPQLRQDVL